MLRPAAGSSQDSPPPAAPSPRARGDAPQWEPGRGSGTAGARGRRASCWAGWRVRGTGPADRHVRREKALYCPTERSRLQRRLSPLARGAAATPPHPNTRVWQDAPGPSMGLDRVGGFRPRAALLPGTTGSLLACEARTWTLSSHPTGVGSMGLARDGQEERDPLTGCAPGSGAAAGGPRPSPPAREPTWGSTSEPTAKPGTRRAAPRQGQESYTRVPRFLPLPCCIYIPEFIPHGCAQRQPRW